MKPLRVALLIGFIFAAAAAIAADRVVIRIGHASKPGLVEPIFVGEKPVTLEGLKIEKGRDVQILADPEADFGTIDKVTEILQLAGASGVSIRREPLPASLTGIEAASPGAGESSGFIITFRAEPTFRASSQEELLDAFKQELPNGVKIHHLGARTDAHGLVGYVAVDDAAAAGAIQKMIAGSDKVALQGIEPATPRKLEMLDNLQDEQVPAAPASMPPQPAFIVPMPGDTEVSATLDSIRVTFDQDMTTSYSWTGEANRPPLAKGEKPRWLDARTCVYPVALERGKFYRIGINSQKEAGFRSRAGQAASPVSIYFTTEGADLGTIRRALKPQITRMEPASGQGEVDPATSELRVTFNVPMGPTHAWVGEGEHFPESPGGAEPRWTPDRRTCNLPVRLEPDWQYQLWLNGNGRTGFQNESGVSIDPIYWTFQTRKGVASSNRATSAAALRIEVDPRIELICVIFRLAGNNEYSRGAVASYNRDVDRWFGGRKNHPAIQMARQLRQTRGVSYDAPAGLAIRLPEQMSDLIGDAPWNINTEGLDGRWNAKDVAEFCEKARDFAQVSRFDKFFADHQDFYKQACDGARRVLERDVHLEWFDKFFGPRLGADFRIVVAPLNGGSNYGSSRKVGKREEMYCILGIWFSDRRGGPAFSRDMSEVVAHEFDHSYSNPIVARHINELQSAGEKLFPGVEKKLRAQAYAHWQTMMIESMVRAAEVRYTMQYRGEFWGKRAMDEQVRRGFPWTPGLVDLLDEYEADRAKYPTLDAFFPRIVAFFNETSRKAPSREELPPSVTKLEPADGAQDVDPALGELRVTFDRPMAPGFSWVGSGEHYPEVPAGMKARWSEDRKTCILPVKLKPDWEYQVSLNSDFFEKFKSAKGAALEPVGWKFKTRK